jgi:hypothetical protein
LILHSCVFSLGVRVGAALLLVLLLLCFNLSHQFVPDQLVFTFMLLLATNPETLFLVAVYACFGPTIIAAFLLRRLFAFTYFLFLLDFFE